jgi:hypothetical protein
MRRWLTAILKQLPKELIKFDDKFFYGVLIAFAGATLAYQRMGRERFMSEYLPAASSALIGVGLMFLFLIVRSAYSVYKEADDRAVNAEAKLAELTKKPKIDIRIKEAFIIPKRDRVAECFVRLLLQNDTAIECKPTDYSLTLRIRGADYDHISPLALSDYKLCYGKVRMVYDEYGTPCEIWATVTSDELSRVSNDFGATAHGEPLEGWIAFAVHNVPEWESSVESIGTYSHTEHDDDGNVIAEYPTDICERILHLTGVESLRVTVEDSFSQTWTQETTGPFESETKRIRPCNVDSEDHAADMFTQPRVT